MSVIPETVDMLPYAGAIAGGVIGATADLLAQRHVARQHESAVEAFKVVAEQYQPSIFQRVGRAATSALMLGGAIAGGVNTVAYLPEEHHELPVRVEMVVDKSGGLAVGGTKPTSIIDSWVSAVEKQKTFNASGIVSTAGQTQQVEVSAIPGITPAGDAPLSQSLKIALDNIAVQNQQTAEARATNAGIVVMTNGNTLGDPGSVVAQANTQRTPITVVNLQGQEAGGDVVKQLQTIAKQTGGNYLDDSTDSASAIADKVKDLSKSLQPISAAEKNNNKLPLRVLGGLAAFATVIYGRRRAQQPLNFKPKTGKN